MIKPATVLFLTSTHDETHLGAQNCHFNGTDDDYPEVNSHRCGQSTICNLYRLFFLRNDVFSTSVLVITPIVIPNGLRDALIEKTQRHEEGKELFNAVADGQQIDRLHGLLGTQNPTSCGEFGALDCWIGLKLPQETPWTA